MKILIIFAIIGLLKVVSLFTLFIIELYNKIAKTGYIEIDKSYGLFPSSGFYIIPTLKVSLYSSDRRMFDIAFIWLTFEYYANYSLKYEKDES